MPCGGLGRSGLKPTLTRDKGNGKTEADPSTSLGVRMTISGVRRRRKRTSAAEAALLWSFFRHG